MSQAAIDDVVARLAAEDIRIVVTPPGEALLVDVLETGVVAAAHLAGDLPGVPGVRVLRGDPLALIAPVACTNQTVTMKHGRK